MLNSQRIHIHQWLVARDPHCRLPLVVVEHTFGQVGKSRPRSFQYLLYHHRGLSVEAWEEAWEVGY